MKADKMHSQREGQRVLREEQLLFAHECHIRNAYAESMCSHRPNERVISRETRYAATGLRADLRTVDQKGTLREWEFKIAAGHIALGQLLTYVAHARVELGFRPVRGVIASFSFTDELQRTIEVMNLNIELVTLPQWMVGGGLAPAVSKSSRSVPFMPKLAKNSQHVKENR